MTSQTKKNLLLLTATVSFVILLLILPGYSYISSDLPKNTWYVFANWNKTTEQKYKLRFGTTFSLLNYIAQHTPPDAIILMPPDSVLLDMESKMNFHKEIIDKNWASYFVYPRKLVYEKEKETNPLHAEVNYVAIVNGWGLDKVHYKLQNKIVTGVIPINL